MTARRRPSQPSQPSRKPATKARSIARQKTALQLHIEGQTYEAIGKHLGVSRQRAHQMCKIEIAEAAAERREVATQALDADLERLDYVMRSLAPKVEKGDPKAATAFLRALERRSKLLGLDAPKRTEHTGPEGGPIAHQIAACEPAALHSRLAASASRAARGADPGATRDADRDRTAGDR